MERARRAGILLAIAAALCVLFASVLDVAAAEPARITVGDSGQVEPGREFSVPVNILGNPGIAGATFVVHYDGNAFELLGYEKSGGVFEDGLMENPAESTVGYLTFPNNNTKDGVLFSVKFKVRENAEAGDYDISIGLRDGQEKNLVNADAQVVAAEFLPGSVTIGGESTGGSISDGTGVGDGNGIVDRIDAKDPASNEPRQIPAGTTFFVKAEEGSLTWDDSALDGRYDAASGGYVFSAKSSGPTSIEYADAAGDHRSIEIEVGADEKPLVATETEKESSLWPAIVVTVIIIVAFVGLFLRRRALGVATEAAAPATEDKGKAE
jgi:hypothetical protein